MKEVAKMFNVHYQTIRNWIKEGKIKPTLIGGIVRISEEEIERLKRGE